MKKTTIGGSALIEGLMMIGPNNSAIAIRKPDGEIEVKKDDIIKRDFLSKIFIIRGVVNFFRQMVLVFKALMYSASMIDLEEGIEEEPGKFEQTMKKIFGDKFGDVLIGFSVVLSICFSVGLFMLLPNVITSFLKSTIFAGATNLDGFSVSGIILHLIEGVVKISIFVIYMLLASRMNEIKRVWMYHGAEHKTINCYEAGEELTVENVRKYTVRHPRCGTSFMVIVMFISIVLFAFTGWWSLWINLLIRILLIPIVAGVSFEVLRWAGRSENKYIQILNKPGQWFQALTTAEPDDGMLEVAIAAMENVLVEDDSDVL